jgi:hypothetical protein
MKGNPDHRCEKCHEKLEKGVAGLVCRSCGLYYDKDATLLFKVENPTVVKIERLINGYKEDV